MGPNEPLRLHLWPHEMSHPNPVVRVSEHYESQGWSQSSATCCDRTASLRSVSSMLDLSPRERTACSVRTTDHWVIESELTRLRKGSRGRRENRTIRFSRSSIPCAWLEHAVEVEMSTDPDMWKNHRETLRGYERAVEEIRMLCEGLSPAWALLSEHGRGPSLPEMKGASIPSNVELSTLFLSNAHFDASVIQRLTARARVEAWSTGWLVSTSELLRAPDADKQAVAVEMWKQLVEWRRRVMHGAHE